MIHHKGLVTITLLLFLFVLVSHCIEYDSLFVSAELRCKAKEREALLKFKQGLIDEDDILSSWGSDEDKKECCKWKGIKCSNKTGHVTGLQLSCLHCHNLLRGKISSALLELSYLNHLDLSFNDFGYNSIPQFIGSLERLQHLNFRGSNFSGVVPYQLGNLTNLRTLDLGSNNLVFKNLNFFSHLSSLSVLGLNGFDFRYTNLLEDIFKLPSLIELHLSYCDIPTDFSVNSSSTTPSILDLSSSELTSSSFHWLLNMSTNLRSIDLSDNYFSFIPDAFGRFTLLEYTDLSYNGLLGGIPKFFGNLRHLQTLILSGNNLSEPLSELFSKLSVGANESLEVLVLHQNQFNGSFLENFGQFFRLEHLDLSDNQITGPMPGLSELVSLKKLYISNNKLKTPFTSLWQLSRLEILDVAFNSFEGTLSDADLSKLQNLKVLNLSHNQITGPMPDLSALVSLKELHLSYNQLKTPFSSLWQLPMLEVLDVALNSFEGTVSDSDLSKLQKLKVLDLSYNSLVLNFSTDWIPPFQLDVIGLACCKMGPRFPAWLQTQTNFSSLDLSCAGISDEVPKWLWDLSPRMLYLNLSHNQVSGIVPDLSSSFVSGPIVDISYNNFSGHLPLFYPHSWALQLKNNMFLGSISSICTISYDGLRILDLSNNQFFGELPNCWDNMTELWSLKLNNNRFSGHIPHNLGSLSNLQLLHLRDNNFSGGLPSTLKKCTYLSMIDVGGNKLTGNIPSWIGAHLEGLQFLFLGNNNFYGSIPLEICYLTEIQILDLSRNSISGTIPQCFNNFTSLVEKNKISSSDLFSMRYGSVVGDFINEALVQWKGQESQYRVTLGLLKLIDLSSNRLVGNIPREFSHMRALISLNLSRNYLSGKIISNINEMEMLECLDLSGNQFFGEIPISLAKLHFLAILDLSNNNLSGKIPSSTQLQSFSASAYAGNSELCGPPLQSCPGDAPKPSIAGYAKQDERDDGIVTHEFIISMVFGFILGFWGVVGTLVIKNSWRNAYFNFFNRMKDWLYVTATIHAMRLRGSLRAIARI